MAWAQKAHKPQEAWRKCFTIWAQWAPTLCLKLAQKYEHFLNIPGLMSNTLLWSTDCTASSILLHPPFFSALSSLFFSWLYLIPPLLCLFLIFLPLMKQALATSFFLLLFPLLSYLCPWRGCLSPNQLKQAFCWSAPGPYYQSMTRSRSVGLSA